MHYDILSQVVEELSSLLTGARVERVLEAEDGGLYLLFRKERENFTLLISPDRSLPRMHLVSKKPRSAAGPHSLVLNLRSRLPGSRLARVALLNEDRIVDMLFAGNGLEHHLFFELTGPSANLFFTDAGLRILASYHPATVPEHAGRLLVSGSPYIPPLKKDRTRQRTTDFSPGFDPTPNKAAEQYYERFAVERQTAAEGVKFGFALAKALKKAERRRAAITEDLLGARQAETFRKTADLILANLQQLKRGMACVKLTGFDGVEVVVTLDPRLSPKENAEAYFRKYKKGKAGLPLIEARLRRTDEEVELLRTRLAEPMAAGDGDSRVRLLIRSSGPQRPEQEDKRRKQVHAATGIRKLLYRGWEILVGANAKTNDELTTKFARPDDLWLHAEGLPGSHVLVRNPQKGDIPADILLKAAALAAFYSKGKGAGKVPVTYTLARFVRKPKGAKPGLVHLERRRTVIVEPGAEEPAGG